MGGVEGRPQRGSGWVFVFNGRAEGTGAGAGHVCADAREGEALHGNCGRNRWPNANGLDLRRAVVWDKDMIQHAQDQQDRLERIVGSVLEDTVHYGGVGRYDARACRGDAAGAGGVIDNKGAGSQPVPGDQVGGVEGRP